MKKYFKWFNNQKFTFGLLSLLVISVTFSSCDDYIYDDKEPDWLGASIYDYLKTNGKFTNYTRMIEDLGYVEVLSTT